VTAVQYDRDAEVAVLADCLASKRARQEARNHLTGIDFYRPEHETIWDAMARLDRQGLAVDVTTVAATVHQDAAARAVVIDLMSAIGMPDAISEHAAIVRGWSVRRMLLTEAGRVTQHALNPAANATGLAASIAARFASIRDSGTVVDDVTALTVTELLEQTDDEPEWLIPGLLERRDRLMLTGEEGLGKSFWLRQIALYAAGGLNPLDPGLRFEPIRTTIIDCENTWSQVRRKIRPVAADVARFGQSPTDRTMVDCTSRMDITRDRDLSRIHRLLDAQQPGLVVIGPLYRLVPRAIQTDDDAAPVLAALDTIRDRGCAVLIEAHAGHAIGKGGTRDLRPRGSSALLGWPEFGFGMRAVASQYCDLVPWRGQREERTWPTRMRHAKDGSTRWIPHDDAEAPTGWGAA